MRTRPHPRTFKELLDHLDTHHAERPPLELDLAGWQRFHRLDHDEESSSTIRIPHRHGEEEAT